MDKINEKPILAFYRQVLETGPKTTGLRPPVEVQVEHRTLETSTRLRDFQPDNEETEKAVVLGPPAMTITSLSKGTIDTDGGESLSVFGDEFPNPAVSGETLKVRFGYITDLRDANGNINTNSPAGEATSVAWVNKTKLNIISPATTHGIYVASVQVTSGARHAEKSSFVLYQRRPLIGSVSPSSGPTGGGTEVIINGGNFTWFDVGTGGTQNYVLYVSFGGPVVGPAIVLSNTQCKVNTPPHAAGKVFVDIINQFNLKSSLSDGYTYGDAPAPPPPPGPGVADFICVDPKGNRLNYGNPNSYPQFAGGIVSFPIYAYRNSDIVGSDTTPAYNTTLNLTYGVYGALLEVSGPSSVQMVNGKCEITVKVLKTTSAHEGGFYLGITDTSNGSIKYCWDSRPPSTVNHIAINSYT